MTSDLERRQLANIETLGELFAERSRSVTLFRYSITHSFAQFAIHDGFPFGRWPLNCRDVSHICGSTTGGPYTLSINESTVPEAGRFELVFGDNELIVRCEGFALGEFGTARSPEADD